MEALLQLYLGELMSAFEEQQPLVLKQSSFLPRPLMTSSHFLAQQSFGLLS